MYYIKNISHTKEFKCENNFEKKAYIKPKKNTGSLEWAARLSIGCFHLTTYSQLPNPCY
jgi:hypothetical protein